MCLFLILTESCEPQSIKSVLCFSYWLACIRSKRRSIQAQHEACSQVRYWQHVPHRRAADHGAKQRRHCRTCEQQLSLCQNTPSPSKAAVPEHLSCGHCQDSPHLVAGFACHQAEPKHLICFPITKPEAAPWIVQSLPLQQEQQPTPICKPSVQHNITASKCARGCVSWVYPQR